MTAACVYCGCTETSACMIRLADLNLTHVRRVKGHSLELHHLQERIACWWVSLTPPVCSAPACVTAHGILTMLTRVSRVGA